MVNNGNMHTVLIRVMFAVFAHDPINISMRIGPDVSGIMCAFV